MGSCGASPPELAFAAVGLVLLKTMIGRKYLFRLGGYPLPHR